MWEKCVYELSITTIAVDHGSINNFLAFDNQSHDGIRKIEIK